jgi:hypothetical protein
MIASVAGLLTGVRHPFAWCKGTNGRLSVGILIGLLSAMVLSSCGGPILYRSPPTADFTQFDGEPTAKAKGNVLEITLPHAKYCSECWPDALVQVAGGRIYLRIRLLSKEQPYVIHKNLPKAATEYKLVWYGTAGQPKVITIMAGSPDHSSDKKSCP